MKAELYYKDPDACSEVIDIIAKRHPNMKRYSAESMSEVRKCLKDLTIIYGNLIGGSEDLYISVDTDDKETINVNGSKYKLIK